MNSEQWLKECNGPLLTYRPEFFNTIANTVPMIKEMDSGLYLIEKREHLDRKDYKLPEYASSLLVNRTQEKDYLKNTLLYRNSRDLARHTEIGVGSNIGLESSGKTGYLFFGPYMKLPKGSYRLELRVASPQTSTAVLDIVNARAGKKYLETHICQKGCSLDTPVLLDLEISEDEYSMEIRMHVQRDDAVLVQSLLLTNLSEEQRSAR